ncbi:hypothetical protein A7P89_03675 [Eikenella corrodens]|jgi:hypothetical protein|uniref:Immunity protein Imm33 domain-containing protein n=1 Tax=Eikenella corrodens TaxID=539 RepID=A0A1A9RT36_EIKCO|nr:DUF2185 domain-containing protein [Eikenella corrodens]OAM23213.1 hypothetical protein A7P89_03675 [Eikenella corrodens]
MLNPKIFSLPEEELPVKDVPQGYAIVSDQVAKEGMPIRFLYREEPDAAFSPDSGWRMFSGFEDDDYADNAANFHLYSLQRMANYQPAIAKLLHSPTGSVFEQDLHQPDFVAVSDWEIPQE